MVLPLPSSLTPSKVSAFKDCALAFRFATIDRLPEPSSPWTAKGTLVHRALERLFWHEEPGRRTPEATRMHFDAAWDELQTDEEYLELGLGGDAAAEFRDHALELSLQLFRLEDPNRVRVLGTELLLSAQLGGMTLRGIVDRLELDEDGGLVVTDYKTGRAPREAFERARLEGVHFYAYLCEQVFGVRPSRVQLLYLSEPVAIVATPSEQSIRGMRVRTEAIWSAVERACEREDFRPKPSRLCDYCAFKAHCPAFGAVTLDAPAAQPANAVAVGVAG